MSNIISVVVVLAAYIIYQKWSMRNIKSMSGSELRALLKQKPKNIQFIDVRTVGEYQQNHLKGFRNIPLDQLKNRKSEIKTDQPVIVMCASGARSSKASKILSSNGFSDITNLKGGIHGVPNA